MTHDHATDGGRVAYDNAVSAYQLRLHLDNSHNLRTNGAGHTHLAALHRGSHGATDRDVARRAGAACIAAPPHRAPGEDWPCQACLKSAAASSFPGSASAGRAGSDDGAAGNARPPTRAAGGSDLSSERR